MQRGVVALPGLTLPVSSPDRKQRTVRHSQGTAVVGGHAVSVWVKEDRSWPLPTQQLPKQGHRWGVTGAGHMHGCGGRQMAVSASTDWDRARAASRLLRGGRPPVRGVAP